MSKAAILAELPTLSSDEREEIRARLRELEMEEHRAMTREEAAEATCEMWIRFREQYGSFAEDAADL